MTLDARKRKLLLTYCEEIREDDGVDPRKFFKVDSKKSKSAFKSEQLCRQIAETMDLVLSGELADDLSCCL